MEFEFKEISGKEETILSSDESDYLENLKKSLENGDEWGEKTILIAVENGYLNCLKYVCEKGFSWPEETTYIIAKNGDLDLLKYVHENGCHWNKDTTYAATINGNLDCLIYSHENGCPWDKTMFSGICDNFHKIKFDWIDFLDCFKYILEKGCPLTDEDGCLWTDEDENYNLSHLAAKYGKLNVLQILHKYNYPFDELTINLALTYTKFNCFKFLYENDCPYKNLLFDTQNMREGIDIHDYLKELLEIFGYVYEANPRKYKNICEVAKKIMTNIDYKHIHNFFSNNGCPFSSSYCSICFQSNNN